ncbi:hypothetical protein [Roseovarius sp. D0-M9]|uniref:hypothetical protein n=1 Tax=Roseovarius sp. D0-M9 TaxID=3127117 RepID=UPI0030101700
MKSVFSSKPTSHLFSNMLVRAGHAFVAAEGKDPTEAGAELADYIRKGDLDQNELDLIAELVTGYWRREQNGAPHISASKKELIVKEYKERSARLWTH